MGRCDWPGCAPTHAYGHAWGHIWGLGEAAAKGLAVLPALQLGFRGLRILGGPYDEYGSLPLTTPWFNAGGPTTGFADIKPGWEWGQKWGTPRRVGLPSMGNGVVHVVGYFAPHGRDRPEGRPWVYPRVR